MRALYFLYPLQLLNLLVVTMFNKSFPRGLFYRWNGSVYKASRCWANSCAWETDLESPCLSSSICLRERGGASFLMLLLHPVERGSKQLRTGVSLTCSLPAGKRRICLWWVSGLWDVGTPREVLEPILETSSDLRLTDRLPCTISCAEVGVDVGGRRGCGSGRWGLR